MVELGRVDICCEVSMMSSRGSSTTVFSYVSHLEKHHNTEMVFKPTTPDIDPNMFPKQDWLNTVYALG